MIIEQYSKHYMKRPKKKSEFSNCIRSARNNLLASEGEECEKKDTWSDFDFLFSSSLHVKLLFFTSCLWSVFDSVSIFVNVANARNKGTEKKKRKEKLPIIVLMTHRFSFVATKPLPIPLPLLPPRQNVYSHEIRHIHYMREARIRTRAKESLWWCVCKLDAKNFFSCKKTKESAANICMRMSTKWKLLISAIYWLFFAYWLTGIHKMLPY